MNFPTNEALMAASRGVQVHVTHRATHFCYNDYVFVQAVPAFATKTELRRIAADSLRKGGIRSDGSGSSSLMTLKACTAKKNWDKRTLLIGRPEDPKNLDSPWHVTLAVWRPPTKKLPKGSYDNTDVIAFARAFTQDHGGDFVLLDVPQHWHERAAIALRWAKDLVEGNSLLNETIEAKASEQHEQPTNA